MKNYTELYLEKIKEMLPPHAKYAERYLSDLGENIQQYIEESNGTATYLRLVQRFGDPADLVNDFVQLQEPVYLINEIDRQYAYIQELKAKIATLSKRPKRWITMVCLVPSVILVFSISAYTLFNFYSNIPTQTNETIEHIYSIQAIEDAQEREELT